MEQPDQEHDIELNGRESPHEIQEGLLRSEARPVLEEGRSLGSSAESFDPLYERVRQSVTVEVQQAPLKWEEEQKAAEPVYAKVQSNTCRGELN